jgi:RNA polymerase subunit RPABC4/transcription elongation factor Spt4
VHFFVMGVFQGLWRISQRVAIALGLSGAAALLAGSAHAQAPTLAGTWSASPLSVSWQLGDWGKACGPAPSGGGEGGGTVTVVQNGTELAFSGAGRAYTTGECWEQYAGIQRISHSASARNFQNVCKTAAGDPRQARLVTTISATDSRINFDETGQYQFVIEGQNCTASVRRSRTYTLLKRLGDESAPPPSAAPSAPAPAAAAARCENAGLPERLEVRPSHKLMRPGETFEFRTTVLDASGCALPVTPTWRVLSGASLLSVQAPGKVTVNPSAAESKASLEVTLGDRSVRVDVEIASKERYDAVLQAQGLSESGESKDAAVARVASQSMGAREVVARDEAPTQSRWVVGVAGAAALLLGLLGIFLVRRSRDAAGAPLPEVTPSRPRAALAPETAKACPTCREEFPPEAEFCPNDGNRLVPQSSLDPGPGGSVCPVCGRGFNPGTATCPDHGEELVPAAAFARAPAPGSTPTIGRTICPVCGKQDSGDTRFCGECGAAVVPIN